LKEIQVPVVEVGLVCLVGNFLSDETPFGPVLGWCTMKDDLNSGKYILPLLVPMRQPHCSFVVVVLLLIVCGVLF
jgi:hypothetical protein